MGPGTNTNTNTAKGSDDSLIDLIEQLTEPAVPPPISMMPQTWGWVALGVLVAVLLAYGIWRSWRYARANAYRRAALQLLYKAQDSPAPIAEILRRTALAAYPHARVASLSGAEWLAFLDREVGGDAFRHGPGSIVATAPYRPAPPDPQLTRLAAQWIRRHRGGIS